MSDGLVQLAEETDAADMRTSEAPCVACFVGSSLDDDRPRLGVVRWAVRRQGRLAVGTAIEFQCPNGHSSDEDAELLKAFRSRLF